MAETVSTLLKQLNISQIELMKTFSDDDFFHGIDHYFNKHVHLIQRQKLKNGYDISASVMEQKKKLKTKLLVIQNEKVHIESFCSCTKTYLCQHAVATLFTFLAQAKKENLYGKSNAHKSSSTKKSKRAVDKWLHDLSDNTEALDEADKNFTLFYHCRIEAHLLNISTHKCKAGKIKPSHKNKISLQQVIYNTPGIDLTIHQADLDIAKLLTTNENKKSYSNEYQIIGDIGELGLKKILASQQAYFHEQYARGLNLGPSREIKFCWKAVKKQYQIQLCVLPDIDDWFELNGLYYIDLNLSECGKLTHCSLHNTQVLKLLKAPPIPLQDAESVSQDMIKFWPEADFPTPADLHIETKDIVGDELVACLQLRSRLEYTEKSSRHHYLGSLSFAYQGIVVQPQTDAQVVIQVKDKIRYRIQRNLDKEAKFIALLATFQLIPANKIIHNSGNYDYVMQGQNEHEQIMLWDALQNKIPDLENQGWSFTVDDSFYLKIDAEEQWQAEIEADQNNDWFSLSLGIEVNGKTIDLLAPILTLLSNYDNPEHLTEALAEKPYTLVPIDKNKWLKVESKRLLNTCEVLMEFYNQETGINKRYVAFMSDMLNDSGLKWKGEASIRSLAEKIKTFDKLAKVETPEGLKAELRQYQQEGLSWLQFLREFRFNGILADDMGLGKTIQTLAHLILEKKSGRMTGPCLIIMPTSLIGNWRKEAEKFTPELNVLILHGSGRNQLFASIADYDLVLTTYPLALRDKEVYQDVNLYYVILDEAQYIKNYKSKTTQALYEIKAKHKLCLTGTPMENHLGELWSSFHFLMAGFLGPLKYYNKTFRAPIEKHGDSDKQLRLQNRIQPFLLRRTKDKVAKELPEKTVIVNTVALSGEQRDLYETVRVAMDQKVQAEIKSKGFARSQIVVLDALLKLRQVCCHPQLLNLSNAKKIKYSAKLDMLMEMVIEMIEEGRKILIFSQFVKMLEIIEKQLIKNNINYAMLTGKSKKREDIIDSFQCGDASIFLISLKAGGVGLNLTAADTVIHYDPWWNPAVENQATDRAYRIGQDKPVFVYKMVTEATVEEKIVLLQEKKQALANAMFQSNKKADELISQQDLLDLLKPFK